MTSMRTYSGTITKVRTKNFLKEGIFQPKEGSPFRFRARALPTVSCELIIQGGVSPDHIFIVKRFYLATKLKEVLSNDVVKSYTKEIRILNQFLGNDGNIDMIIENPGLIDHWLGKDNAIAVKLKDYFKHHIYLPNLMNYLYPFGLSRKKIQDIYAKLGGQAIDLIEDDPYLLVEVNSIPFRIADRLAQENGIPFHFSNRLRGAVRYVYLQYLNSGNGYLTLNEFEGRVHRLLSKSISKEKIRLEIEQFVQSEQNQILQKGNLFYDRHLFFAEIQIAQRLADLTSWSTKPPKNIFDTINNLVYAGNLPKLDHNQMEGIERFFKHPILLVQGEAGTGKTSWISFLLVVLKELLPNAVIKLAAPTGKAARRMSSITGFPAQTIHSLLGKGIEKNSRILYHYKKNALNTDVLIIDEASMVDEYLWRDIVWSVERGTKIVYVGDSNQLEPIGPGKPFADMIILGFPTVTLNHNYRNESAVLALAKSILREDIDLSLLEQKGIQFIPCETVEEIKESLVQIYSEKNGKYPVVSMYREEFSLGIDQINPFMKERINPTRSEIGMGNKDPVIQIYNSANVDNGDVGIIQDFNPLQTTRIYFEQAKEMNYTLTEMLDYLELAYAITTTKTQGSQYEGVIIPLMDINQELAHRHSMWYKNSLYTAITRAQKELILIGDLKELIDGVKYKGMSRRTHLVKRIQKIFGMPSLQSGTEKP